MPRKPTGNPNGRPPVDIDKKKFEKLCAWQCTEKEMADFFDCDPDTINNWCKRTYGNTFSEVFKQKRAGGKISLRASGFKMAQSNPTVWIFHAKNFLGMTDKIEQTVMEVEDLTSLADMLRDDAPAESEDDDANSNQADD